MFHYEATAILSCTLDLKNTVGKFLCLLYYVDQFVIYIYIYKKDKAN